MSCNTSPQCKQFASTAVIAVLNGCQARGCPLVGLAATPDLEAHRRRFLDNGWSRADARDMLAVYRQHIDPDDRRRCGMASARRALWHGTDHFAAFSPRV